MLKYCVFRGLKQLVTPLLARLLESNMDKMMKFDEFFSAVNVICEKHITEVFHVNTCTLLKIYVNKNEKYA